MIPPNDWAEAASSDLVEHLRSRTMAGLPHIGILGPKPIDAHPPATNKVVTKNDEPSDIEEDEFTMQSGSDDDDPNFPDWKFVPNKFVYHLSPTPVGTDPFVTEISFYIRLDEGCDGDIDPNLSDRPAKYVLTKDALMAVFRHYLVKISNDPTFSSMPEVSVIVDGKSIVVPVESLKVSATPDLQSVELTLSDESKVFLTYVQGKMQLTKQRYLITVKKETRKEQDGRVSINVEIRNHSPRTQRSVIPDLGEDKSSGRILNEDEALQKLNEELGENPLLSEYRPIFFKTPRVTDNPEGNRYGYLMEFEASEIFHSSTKPYDQKDAALTVNAIMDDSHLSITAGHYSGKVVFRDHAVFQEDVPVMAPGASPKELFNQMRMDGALALVLSEDMKFEYLHKFQDASIRKLVEGLRSVKKNMTFLLSARTAGGKTEAFLIPIAQACLEDESLGVKALIFYPTKALANDQTNRYIEVLFHLNKRIGTKRRKVTLGLLHGDISRKEPEEGSQDEWDLPLACPNCKEGTLKTAGDGLTCDKCGEVLDFVRVSNRQLVYSNPPDILITNPDTLVWDLMLRPQNHSIFGRQVTICKKCGWSYAPKGTKRVCENEQCKSKMLEEIRPTPPRIIVFDEVHIFRGTFGINCSYFVSRLEGLIRKYSAEHHGIADPKIIKIGSSATISNPGNFAKDFFNCGVDELILVPKDDAERDSFYLRGRRDEDVRRHHVYIMPYAYNTDSTIGRSIHYLEMRSYSGRPPTRLHDIRQSWGEFLQTICFVNSIRASNNLISLTSRTVSEDLPGLKVNGHTTDFDKKQRANIERRFNRQDLHVIFATQTLEVGIDFRRVDVVMINGFPFSFNDYLQRIGRGGRKRDSLVVTVCQNWKPIDHYYYSNAKEALKNPALHMEPIPITRNNLEAVKKHARGAVLDFIMSGTDAAEYVDDVRKLKSIAAIQDAAIQYCIELLEPNEAFKEEVKSTVIDFIKEVQNVASNEINSKTLFSKFKENINERFQLTSLRSTDREVLVEVMWAK